MQEEKATWEEARASGFEHFTVDLVSYFGRDIPSTSALVEYGEGIRQAMLRGEVDKHRYRKRVKKIAKKIKAYWNILRDCSKGEVRGKAIQAATDDVYLRVKKDPGIRCKKSCAACCYILVTTSQDEAALIANRVRSDVPIDMDRLRKQAEVSNDSDAWFSQPMEIKRCVFLDDGNNCRIYEDRPTACRNHFSVSPPVMCEPDENNKPKRHLKWMSEDAEVLATAGMLATDKNDSLPRLLLEELGKCH